MGTFKYKELGIPYRLENVNPLSAERKQNALRIFREHVSCPVV